MTSVSAPQPDSPDTDSQDRLLELRGVKTHFDTRDGVVKAVDEVSLGVDRGEVLGIVGEWDAASL